MSENGRAESARDATQTEETSIKSECAAARGAGIEVRWSGDEHAQSSTVR